jgi:hypothetical protein
MLIKHKMIILGSGVSTTINSAMKKEDFRSISPNTQIRIAHDIPPAAEASEL